MKTKTMKVFNIAPFLFPTLLFMMLCLLLL